jgi:single-strand DNA-binding protein
MMMQKNRIEIAGVLAAKPVVRLMPSGTRVANVRLAEDYFHRDKDGKLISHTNWHSLAFYDELSSIATTYEKGENIFVEGSIEQRKFTPKDGRERTIHEVMVRSCHLIAPPRSRRMTVEQDFAKTEGVTADENWPVTAA